MDKRDFWDQVAEASRSMQYVLERGSVTNAFEHNAKQPELDMFKLMWSQQEQFMKLLQQKRGQTPFPVDLTTKAGQKVVKDYMHECIDELAEAIAELRNSKSHRATDVGGADRERFLEESVDALHYFCEFLIFAGYTPEEVCKAYLEKGEINRKRIENGY